ncbi:MAG: TRAP transporter substrate-binding protein DctP, partial [Pseudomonadota bacterium]
AILVSLQGFGILLRQLSSPPEPLKCSVRRSSTDRPCRTLRWVGQCWHNGMKQMSANKPLIDPADANGLKFRVQSSDVLVAQMEAIGGTPQKMAFSEVYGALQQGVVDGQENTWSNIFGKKFFEVQDGVTETNHGIIDYLLVTSVDWLDSLDADVRDQFLTIVAEVTESRNKESTKVNDEAKQAIIAAGGTVRTLTPEQRAMWVETMKPVWAKFEGDVGAENIAAAQDANKLTN